MPIAAIALLNRKEMWQKSFQDLHDRQRHQLKSWQSHGQVLGLEVVGILELGFCIPFIVLTLLLEVYGAQLFWEKSSQLDHADPHWLMGSCGLGKQMASQEMLEELLQELQKVEVPRGNDSSL